MIDTATNAGKLITGIYRDVILVDEDTWTHMAMRGRKLSEGLRNGNWRRSATGHIHMDVGRKILLHTFSRARK